MQVMVLQHADARKRLLLDGPFEALRDEVTGVWLNPLKDQTPAIDELADPLATAEAIVTGWNCSPLTAEHYALAPRLKLVALIGSSIKPVLPEAAWQRDIQITNTARAIGVGVAEYTVGLMLHWLHKYDQYDRGMKAGADWAAMKRDLLQRNLADVCVGLIGCGAVGAEVGRLLRAWDARVIAYDPYIPVSRLHELGIERIDDLRQLIAASDIVSVHTGLNDDTHHMIGPDELAAIRDGALFVNTSRGAVVDESALIAALRMGRFDAALDVYEQEPLPSASGLRRLDNVILSPHSGASSNLSVFKRCAAAVVDDIRRVRDGRTPLNVVTPEMFARMT